MLMMVILLLNSAFAEAAAPKIAAQFKQQAGTMTAELDVTTIDTAPLTCQRQKIKACIGAAFSGCDGVSTTDCYISAYCNVTSCMTIIAFSDIPFDQTPPRSGHVFFDSTGPPLGFINPAPFSTGSPVCFISPEPLFIEPLSDFINSAPISIGLLSDFINSVLVFVGFYSDSGCSSSPSGLPAALLFCGPYGAVD
jgi:hypothetical protein